MSEQKQKVYLLGEFVLDVAQRSLSLQGARVHLSHLPFQVLLHLLEHRDRVVTRDELLDLFWEGRDVYQDALRKSVSAIRKALGDRKDNPRFIETRWTEGYRYIGPLAEKSSDELIKEESTPLSLSAVSPADFTSSITSAQISSLKRYRLAIPRRFSWVFVGLFSVLSLLVFGAAFYRNRRPDSLPVHPIARSLAILPLKNLTGDASQDYFSDGVTESLISEIAKVRELKVIARNSAFAFKGKEVDVREIGRRLGVANVLEGNLRRDADSVRVTVRLVSTEDGRVIWTGDITRSLDEITRIQDDIGCGVAESLQAVLCREPNYKRGTNNLVAYDAYLKGRDRRVKGDAKAAAEFFQQAIKVDPNYALGWAGLAEAYTVMEVNSLVPPRSVAPKAKECAFKAIALDGSLAAPYAALGLLTSYSDRRWAEGDRYFQQALANHPNYAIAHSWYGNTLMAQGKFAEAEAAYLRANVLDPLNPGFHNSLAETYYYWRKPALCLAQAAKALELQPGNGWGQFNQVKCLALTGRYEDALQVPLPREFQNLTRCNVLALAGRQAEARKLLPLVIKDWGHTSPYAVAGLYATLGERDTAFAWLQKAADQQQADLVSLKVEPSFDGLRNDPRYAELLRRVGLSQ